MGVYRKAGNSISRSVYADLMMVFNQTGILIAKEAATPICESHFGAVMLASG